MSRTRKRTTLTRAATPWLEFLRTHNLAIPRDYGAGWLVLRSGEHVAPGARLVYRDERFRVYRL